MRCAQALHTSTIWLPPRPSTLEHNLHGPLRQSVARALQVPPLRAIRNRRSVVLGYHGVSRADLAHDLSRLQVPPETFRKQVVLLREAGFRFVTMAELVSCAAGSTPAPGMAAITFDDGMRNNYRVALPILEELGIRATVYVTTDFIDSHSPWIGPSGDSAMLSANEVRALAAAGWEIGAHTVTHADLSTLDYDACLHEISDSRDVLEGITGQRVQTVAYPFGRYSPAAISAAQDAGMTAAVTTGSGTWAPYEMTRAMISSGDPLPLVLLKLTDRYEPLLALPAFAALRSISRQGRELLRRRGESIR